MNREVQSEKPVLPGLISRYAGAIPRVDNGLYGADRGKGGVVQRFFADRIWGGPAKKCAVGRCARSGPRFHVGGVLHGATSASARPTKPRSSVSLMDAVSQAGLVS